MPTTKLDNFIHAMERVYGPFKSLTPDLARSWAAPPAPGGHLGRYLWTDAFGILNFLTRPISQASHPQSP